MLVLSTYNPDAREVAFLPHVNLSHTFTILPTLYQTLAQVSPAGVRRVWKHRASDALVQARTGRYQNLPHERERADEILDVLLDELTVANVTVKRGA